MVGPGLRLGKRDHLPDRGLALQHHHQTVDPEGETGVWRGAVTEGLEEPAESALGCVCVDSQDLEHLSLHVGIVDTNRPRAELDPVENDVIRHG
jgi:hypothetical protein